jgi:hypothetical protein
MSFKKPFVGETVLYFPDKTKPDYYPAIVVDNRDEGRMLRKIAVVGFGEPFWQPKEHVMHYSDVALNPGYTSFWVSLWHVEAVLKSQVQPGTPS